MNIANANKKFTIIVKNSRVDVSEDVYRAYHQEREAERYREKLIVQNELSIDRFEDEGVNANYPMMDEEQSVEDILLQKEEYRTLKQALLWLDTDELFIIRELFFNGKSERMLSEERGVPRMTLSYKKRCILQKLKKIIKK